MAGGRPTDYDDSILEKTIDYLENHESYGDVVPSIAGLSVHIDVTRKTIYAWTEREGNEEFLYNVKKLMSLQERKLLYGGLNNDFNASITKLMLSKHGYVEKQDHTSSDGSMSPQKKDFNDFYEEGTE